jgi:signal peptidase I
MLWLVFSFCLYGFAGPPLWFYNVPSSSMADTLLVGDVFLADLDAYAVDGPRRGDVAVFDHRGTTYVKRVIGLPGDHVRMLNGAVVLNGTPVERHLASDAPLPGEPAAARLYVEKLPDGASYETLSLEMHGALDDTQEVAIPPGHFFVLGDNRDNSVDSRLPQIGLVARRELVGRATTLLFSIDRDTGEVRSGRFLQPIR